MNSELVILEDRQNYDNLRIDITIPTKKIAIEFNGTYWHKVNGKIKRHPNHLNKKRLKMQKHGLRVFNIYEDEWDNDKDRIKNIIKKSICTVSREIYANKCKILKCGSNDKLISPFISKYNYFAIKRKINGEVYCLIYDNEVVSCAIFSNDILVSYLSPSDIKIHNGLLTLISAFHSDHSKISTLIAYCDNRFFTGKSYSEVGFKKKTDGVVGYNVIIPQKTLIRKPIEYIYSSKFKSFFTAEQLQNNNEFELATIMGYHIVPDCGFSQFELTF